MEKRLSSEHRSELFSNSLEHFLDCSWVADKSCCHSQTIRWNITNGTLDIIRNPFNEV